MKHVLAAAATAAGIASTAAVADSIEIRHSVEGSCRVDLRGGKNVDWLEPVSDEQYR
ncbi:hypothetical protein [Paraburkholderia sp. JHI869]|uniref:hypothetical protein n=1 Tax=Paraburkholderia sp. JHI869 TaxID=3112959 RepID=UPI00316D5308